ncbi:unnamed protein product [Allacma fusca]|uniref:BED-type domain-containing protein n=1 Tax=Allacma fusca TaxID=39272 RepID=A0A8J2JMX7_9HEXA|nr:unnamed protein product [Allacma fusca]
MLSIKRKSKEQCESSQAIKTRKTNLEEVVIEPEDFPEMPAGVIIKRRNNYEINCKISKEAFSYSGHKIQITTGVTDKEKELGIVANCKFCNRNLVYQGPSKGGTSNLIRHLKNSHAQDLEKIQALVAKDIKGEQTVMKSWITGQTGKTYNSNDPIQRKFTKSLLFCIAKDKLPFNVVNGTGFKNMIHTLDPGLHIPSRTTIQRNFKKECEKKAS